MLPVVHYMLIIKWYNGCIQIVRYRWTIPYQLAPFLIEFAHSLQTGLRKAFQTRHFLLQLLLGILLLGHVSVVSALRNSMFAKRTRAAHLLFRECVVGFLGELMPIIKIRVRQMDRKSQTALLRRKRQSIIKLLCNKYNGCASSSSHRFQICGSPKKNATIASALPTN